MRFVVMAGIFLVGGFVAWIYNQYFPGALLAYIVVAGIGTLYNCLS